jgi:pantetheine-phosphate adenylyltransferase
MNLQVVFPGTFSPPTYGHLEVVRAVCEIFPTVTILCSVNEEKESSRWFNEEECLELWQYYDLPKNVKLATFTEAKNNFDFSKLVMVRGVREEDDFDHEKKVVMSNHKKLGINKIFYFVAGKSLVKTSSSCVRKAAVELNFMELAKHVSPMVITTVLEKVLKAKNLFMVVGQPGSGKSTFLQAVQIVDENSIWINTDEISQQTKSILYERFGSDADLIKVMIENEQEATALIAERWFAILAEMLRQIPVGKNIFLEVPYGLMSGKEMYKYLGGKIIYVGCEDEETNCQRLMARGTKQHKQFLNQIPGLEDSRHICREERLELTEFDTSGDIKDTHQQAVKFCQKLDS